jgi:hypothetical protein
MSLNTLQNILAKSLIIDRLLNKIIDYIVDIILSIINLVTNYTKRTIFPEKKSDKVNFVIFVKNAFNTAVKISGT